MSPAASFLRHRGRRDPGVESSAHRPFQPRPGDPVVPPRLDVGTFGRHLALLGQQQVVGAFEHHVVALESQVQDLHALWQQDAAVVPRHVPRGQEEVPGLPHLGADVDREGLELSLSLSVLGLQTSDRCPSRVEDGELQRDRRAGDSPPATVLLGLDSDLDADREVPRPSLQRESASDDVHAPARGGDVEALRDGQRLQPLERDLVTGDRRQLARDPQPVSAPYRPSSRLSRSRSLRTRAASTATSTLDWLYVAWCVARSRSFIVPASCCFRANSAAARLTSMISSSRPTSWRRACKLKHAVFTSAASSTTALPTRSFVCSSCAAPIFLRRGRVKMSSTSWTTPSSTLFPDGSPFGNRRKPSNSGFLRSADCARSAWETPISSNAAWSERLLTRAMRTAASAVRSSFSSSRTAPATLSPSAVVRTHVAWAPVRSDTAFSMSVKAGCGSTLAQPARSAVEPAASRMRFTAWARSWVAPAASRGSRRRSGTCRACFPSPAGAWGTNTHPRPPPFHPEAPVPPGPWRPPGPPWKTGVAEWLPRNRTARIQ